MKISDFFKAKKFINNKRNLDEKEKNNYLYKNSKTKNDNTHSLN